MRKKVIIGLFIVIIIFAARGIIKFMKNPPKEAEMIEDTEVIPDAEIPEEMNRPNEEYIAIFLDNREDFEYVVEKMKQWPDVSIIEFGVRISSENQEIAYEIENNTEFYEHLKNLYDLEEIRDVVKWKDNIEFGFSKPPVNYHGGWYYWEDTEKGGLMKTAVIDEHWTLEMLPNV